MRTIINRRKFLLFGGAAVAAFVLPSIPDQRIHDIIDGVELKIGDRLLSIGQSDSKLNGVYVVTAGKWGPDTSDIPEVDEAWFKRARLSNRRVAA